GNSTPILIASAARAVMTKGAAIWVAPIAAPASKVRRLMPDFGPLMSFMIFSLLLAPLMRSLAVCIGRNRASGVVQLPPAAADMPRPNPRGWMNNDPDCDRKFQNEIALKT